MSDEEQTSIARLQAIMTSLMERHLEASLEQVDGALANWRDGQCGVFEAHAELLKHAAQAERMAERMARIGLDNAGSLLRDAYDAQLIDRNEFMSFVGKEPSQVEPSPPLGDIVGMVGLPDKRALIEELLEQGPILVHIDARNGECQVPERFRKDPKLVLRFGYGLTPAIVDLSIDAEGMCGTLTFGGVPFRCVLPWAAVYSVVSEADQKGMVWPDDVPDCVVDAITEGSAIDGKRARRDSASQSDADEIGKRPVFSVSSSMDLGDDGREPPPPSSPPRGGHLKLVK